MCRPGICFRCKKMRILVGVCTPDLKQQHIDQISALLRRDYAGNICACQHANGPRMVTNG